MILVIDLQKVILLDTKTNKKNNNNIFKVQGPQFF
jgi:hypothetical protein